MMPIEKQLINFSYAKKLAELGVKQESYFYWNRLYAFGSPTDHDKYEIRDLNGLFRDHEHCSAFSTAELFVMLPPEISIKGEYYCLCISKNYNNRFKLWYQMVDQTIPFSSRDENLANTISSALIALIDHKLITVSEINEKITAA